MNTKKALLIIVSVFVLLVGIAALLYMLPGKAQNTKAPAACENNSKIVEINEGDSADTEKINNQTPKTREIEYETTGPKADEPAEPKQEPDETEVSFDKAPESVSTKQEVIKPEPPVSEAANTEASKSIPQNPEAEKSEVWKSEPAKPEKANAGIAKPEATEPKITEAVTTEAETSEAVVTEPEITEPEVTEPAKPERNEPSAMDFTVYDANGNAVKLSDYIGKPIVLNFWASWCGPCRNEMPAFHEKYLALGGEIQFLMVNMTGYETLATAQEFIAENGYTFPVLYDTESDAANTYSVYSLPTTYFIDAEGYLIAVATGAINADTLQSGIDMIY